VLFLTFPVAAGVLIGAGSFAKVYRGRWRQQHVAVKVLHLLGSKAAAKAMAEAAVMIRARHPNVVAAHHVTMWQRARQISGLAHCVANGSCDASCNCYEQQQASFASTDNSSSSSSTGQPSFDVNTLSTVDGSAHGSTNSFNSSSGSGSSNAHSTSIIEGGWGVDELCEAGREDCEDDIETQVGPGSSTVAVIHISKYAIDS
jgi:hypothetical protein